MAKNRTMMIMVGPDGVGKTTLLATMYHELSFLENLAGFEFTASEDTHQDLQEAYDKLHQIITQPTFTPTGSLLRGTAGIVERQFEVLFNGKKELDFVFCDIAGGIIRADESNPDFVDFQQKLEQSTIIINVIDGSALIEGDNQFSTQKNEPELVYDLLFPKLIDNRNHLLLFVITKCEAWLKNEKRQQQLIEAFEKRYSFILNLVNQFQNVIAVLMPVKTLGCVEFIHIDFHNNEQEVIFMRKPNLQFKSENVDQPLRYAIAFALVQHNQNRGRWSRFTRWLWNNDIVFQSALHEFADARVNNFKVYGNTKLIEVE